MYLKLIPVFVLSLIMISSVMQPADAGIDGCVSVDGGGLWSEPDTWNCNGGTEATDVGIQVYINSDHTVTADVDVNPTQVYVDSSATLIVNSGITITTEELHNASPNTIENNGTIVTDEFINDGTYNNNCGSSLTITDQGFNTGTFNNFGTFVLAGPAFFNNDGTFNNGGILDLEEGSEFNDEEDIIEVPDQCQSVGGTNIPINTSSLLLAGAASVSMWMIPVVVAGAGIGIFVLKRK